MPAYKAILSYHIPKEDPKRPQVIKNILDAISTLDGSVEISADLNSLNIYDVFSHITLQAEKDKIEPALREFYGIAGNPYCATAKDGKWFSDYGPIERPLTPGKKLKRRFRSFFIGKYVVGVE